MAKTIYILEEDQDVQFIMQHILEEHGYEVQLTDSATIALDIRSVKPDLILLDAWLTKSDPEFGKRLKKEPVTANVPIIVTSTEYTIQPAIKEIADDILSKPFDLEDLVAKVGYWLKKMGKDK
jgi:DNA-binding response OmpR family regulator